MTAETLTPTQAARLRRHQSMLDGELDPPHGSYSTYVNYACRCDECREANRAYAQKRAEAKAAQTTLDLDEDSA